MNVTLHDINGTQVAEMQSEGIIIRNARDAADIIGELLDRGVKKLILHERNLCPEFWQLSNGLASAILEKFANYSVAVAFVGAFHRYKSKSLTSFVQESNLGDQVIFSDTVELAKVQLSGTTKTEK